MEFAAAVAAQQQGQGHHADNENNVENVSEYWNVFNKKRNDIDTDIAKLVQMEFKQPVSIEETTKCNKIIDGIKTTVVNLQKFSSECTRLLPAYDVKRSQEEIEKFNKSLKQVALKLKPEKTFSFSSKKKDIKKGDDDASSSSSGTTKEESSIARRVAAIGVDLEKKEAKIADIGSHTISDVCDNNGIVLSSRDVQTLCDNKSDLQLQLLIKNCTNCTISVSHTLGSVRLESLKNCTVLLGPICTSCYLENCVDCLLFIASHQLRIHNTHNTKLYVRVNSHPIIEDCSSLGFAYYNIFYDDMPAHLSKANLTDSHNYCNVVDFRWHKSTASPNWHISRKPATIPLQLQPLWSVSLESQGSGMPDDNGNDDDEM